MKPKQIPRVAKIWLLILGYWGGSIATLIVIALSVTVNSPLALYILVGAYLGSVVLFYLIGWKYRTTLEEWGLITPKKEKGKQ